MLLCCWHRDPVGYVAVLLMKRSLEVGITLYTLYMWHCYRGNLRGGGRRRSMSTCVPGAARPLTFMTPTHSTKNLLARDSRLRRCRGGLCSSVIIFLQLWNSAVQYLTCHHNISRSLQTIRRRWTYFKGVCLDWRHTDGETETFQRTGPDLRDHAACSSLGLFTEIYSPPCLKSTLEWNGIATVWPQLKGPFPPMSENTFSLSWPIKSWFLGLWNSCFKQNYFSEHRIYTLSAFWSLIMN